MNDFCPDKAEIEWHINFYIKRDDLSNALTLSEGLALYDISKGSAGIVRWPKVNDFWPDKAEIERHINLYIKMDDLSNASTLSG